MSASASDRSESTFSSGSSVVRAALRIWSTPLFLPTKISHAVGSRGGPLSGQVRIALRQASWNASSAVSRSRK